METFVHFIWIGSSPFLYAYNLAIQTANKIYGKVYLWVDDTERDICKSLGNVDIQPLKSKWLKSLKGIEDPMWMSDYLRYCILLEYGGLYLDLDTVCVKSILDIKDLGSLAVGIQRETRQVSIQSLRGSLRAINGAILYTSIQEHPDIVKLVQLCDYKLQVRGKDLEGYCPLGPRVLSQVVWQSSNNPNILSPDFFYYYGWHEWEEWFKDNSLHSSIYIIHWWNLLAKKFAKNITKEYILTSNSLYAHAVRQTLGNSL